MNLRISTDLRGNYDLRKCRLDYLFHNAVQAVGRDISLDGQRLGDQVRDRAQIIALGVDSDQQ